MLSVVIGMRRMTGTREYLVALGVLAAGAVAGIVLAGATWATAEVSGVLGTDEVSIAGADLVPVTEAAGWLGLAAVVAIHASRGVGRAIVGGLLVVAGLAVAGWAGRYAVDMDPAVDAAEPAGTGDAAVTLVSTAPAAAGGTVIAGVLIAAAGVLTALRGRRWPAMGRKYERTGGTDSGRDASGPGDAWAALDRGDDPTTWLRDPEQTRQNEAEATNGPGRPSRP